MTRAVHPLRLLALLALLAESTVAQAAGRPIQVPRGSLTTIDGVLDEPAWERALRIESPRGTVVRLMRDDTHLFIGVTSEREGFASLCLARGDVVHVLHASAALGAITYRRSGDAWQSADTAFHFDMRNQALDAAARAERAAYLREHGWVASTMQMAEGRSQELQIALDRFAPPLSIALGRFVMPNGVEWWPGSLEATDGCASSRLVSGYVPQGLRFDVGRWLTIEG